MRDMNDWPRVQTKRDIEQLLASAGHRPQHRFGQNFLIDGNLMRRLVDSAEITREDVVLEVGAGTGSLTDQLAARAGRVISVEIDTPLVGVLRDRFSDVKHVEIVEADVLASKHRISQLVLNAMEKARSQCSGQMLLVANLPYHVATPVLANLLTGDTQFDRMCFTVQREVGDRILGSPGTRDFGPVSVLFQCTCRIERLAILKPDVFWPRPDIDSAMLMATATGHPFGDSAGLLRFMGLVRGSFLHRRKTLKSNLSRLLESEAFDRVSTEFDLSRRPETLSVEEWVHLTQIAGY